MVRNIIEANSVKISGKFENKFEFSHENRGEKFYSNRVMIERLSGTYDFVPVLVSDRLINVGAAEAGKMVEIEGQLRSYNCHEDGKSHLILNVFSQEIQMDDVLAANTNTIYLEGYICKKPIYRVTPFGREICDLLVAVNRAYGKSDYIPCIAWGRNARYAAECRVGTKLTIRGRLQSREYEKNGGKKTAYEVSVMWLNAESR